MMNRPDGAVTAHAGRAGFTHPGAHAPQAKGQEMKAWHFTADTLRDGRPIPPIGETLVHDGPLIMCQSGLHASVRAIDALRYAPGPFVHRVRCGGETVLEGDKLICAERTILWSIDAAEVLRHFARLCALDVIHLWDAPKIVVQYLRTGDETIRDAAWSASWPAAQAAARSAARSASQDAQNKRLARMLNAEHAKAAEST